MGARAAVKKTPSRIALLDLDGTVADYDGAADAQLAKLRSPHEPRIAYPRDEEPGWLKARRALVTRVPGFWRNLPVLEVGFEIYELLLELGFEVHVLTKGPKSRTKSGAWTEKVDWCRAHLPHAKITITEDKSTVYGRVLVDDWPEYYVAWMAHRPRGLVLVPEQPWNAGVPENVIRVGYGADCWAPDSQALREVLIAARDREDGEVA